MYVVSGQEIFLSNELKYVRSLHLQGISVADAQWQAVEPAQPLDAQTA
jgi:hypothetical protein